jgi:hypothetical protein
MKLWPHVVAFVLLVAFVSCGGGATKGVLEAGGPRIPNDEGVVTDASFQRIQLGGTRPYAIAANVESFIAASHRVTSLLAWKGKFVQIGLDSGKNVIWIAGIGTVVQGNPPLVYYSGIVDRFDKTRYRVYFRDGTVLRATAAVGAPEIGRRILCQLDASRGVVTKISAG